MGRFLMLLLAASLVLAAAKAVIMVIVLMIVLMLVWGALSRPRETAGWMLFGGWITLLQTQPVVAVLALLAFLICAGIWRRRARDSIKTDSSAQTNHPRRLLSAPPAARDADDLKPSGRSGGQ